MRDRPISEYIIGASPDGDREYVVRAQAPRFIARVFISAEESMVDDEAIGEGAGTSLIFDHDGDEVEISIMEWIDPAPEPEDVQNLLRRAAAAFEEADLHADDMMEAQALQPMTPEELRAAGEAIWGGRWQTPLARRIGVDPRTVRYWVAGKVEVPPARAHVIRGWALKAMRQ